MPATWPGTLPQRINVDGNQENMGDGRLQSPTDTGPGKVRRRSSAVARPLTGSIEVTEAQLAIFEAFVEDDIAGGSLPFDFPVTRGSGTWLVRFGDQMPSWSNIGPDHWRINMALVILP